MDRRPSMFKIDPSQDCFPCVARFLVWGVIFICFGCLFSSILSGNPNCNSRMASNSQRLLFDPVQFEGFSNDNMFLTNSLPTSQFASAQLNAVSNADGSPSNMMIGQIKRHVYQPASGKNLIARFLVWAELYQLNGDLFNQPIQQTYKVYLLGADKSKILLGPLVRNGDNWYKLDVQRQDVEQVVSKRLVYIVYEKDGKETLLLTGQFT